MKNESGSIWFKLFLDSRFFMIIK